MTVSVVEFIFGLIFFIVPFFLVLRFEDKFKGFLYVSLGWILFQISIALLTQYFGVFTYGVVAGINLIGTVASVIAFWRTPQIARVPHNPEKPSTSRTSSRFSSGLWIIKKNWIVGVAFAIVFFELFSVHYFYTGIVSTINGFETVSQNSYNYPFFSDEYVGVALAEYSIRSHSLPLVDPLNANAPFANMLFVFFSVTAELLLLFGMNPLTGYPIFALVAGLVICLLSYIYLRRLRVSAFPASIAVMTVPLIINGANLPGIWFYLPFILGFVIFLLGLLAFGLRDGRDQNRFFIIASVISLVIYPPMIVFIVLVAIVIFRNYKTTVTRSIVAVVLILVAILSALEIPFIKTGVSFIFRNNLVGGIPSFPIWIVMPWFILPFALLGMWRLLKSKRYELPAAVVVGLAFWVAYAFTMNVFIIDYPRIVEITSLLLVLCSGVGLGFLIEKIEVNRKYHAFSWLFEIAVCFVFLFMALSYPLDSWSSLVLHVRSSSDSDVQTIYPASPISRYLTDEDLRLFSGITGKWFIAPAWKGLVIGAATGNFPLESKASTLTESTYDYSTFVDLDCDGKAAVTRALHIDYVYSSDFSCPDFTFIGSSSEKLNLYAFSGKI